MNSINISIITHLWPLKSNEIHIYLNVNFVIYLYKKKLSKRTFLATVRFFIRQEPVKNEAKIFHIILNTSFFDVSCLMKKFILWVELTLLWRVIIVEWLEWFVNISIFQGHFLKSPRNFYYVLKYFVECYRYPVMEIEQTKMKLICLLLL